MRELKKSQKKKKRERERFTPKITFNPPLPYP